MMQAVSWRRRVSPHPSVLSDFTLNRTKMFHVNVLVRLTVAQMHLREAARCERGNLGIVRTCDNIKLCFVNF